MPDVDIDFFDRDGTLKLFKHAPASIIKDDKIEKHKTVVYFHAVPTHPITGHSTLDYKKAEDRGYFKIDFEIADDIEFDDGDCCVIIKSNGTIGRVVMPEMNKSIIDTAGYKKLLDVLEIIKPGSKKDFIKYNQEEKRKSYH